MRRSNLKFLCAGEDHVLRQIHQQYSCTTTVALAETCISDILLYFPLYNFNLYYFMQQQQLISR
jgi:hypothetical protein